MQSFASAYTKKMLIEWKFPGLVKHFFLPFRAMHPIKL